MKVSHPKVLHIVGPKKSGKTTLIEFIIRELTARGLKVGAFKHSSHQHPLDKPGSDSHRHRSAGANPAAFATQEGLALFFQNQGEEHLETILAAVYRGCDLVLVESFRSANGPKIAILNAEDDLKGLKNVTAVFTESGRHPRFPAFRPRDTALVEFIIEMLKI